MGDDMNVEMTEKGNQPIKAEFVNLNSKDNVSPMHGVTTTADDPISFENALQMTGYGKLNIYLVIIAGFVMTASLIETLSISFVLPVTDCDMHFSSTQKGLLSAVAFVGIIASSYLWGYLSDTKGRRAIIVPSLFIAFFCTLLSSLSASFWFLLVTRFLNGFFMSGSSASIYAYLGEFHTIQHRARSIMMASVIFGMGGIAMPGLAFLVINHSWQFAVPFLGIVYKPWRLFLFVCGTPSLLCAIALLPVPESPKFLLSLGHQLKCLETLEWMRKWNGGDRNNRIEIRELLEEPESVEMRRKRQSNGSGVMAVFRSMWQQTKPLFGPSCLLTISIACAMQFGAFFNANGIFMWFPDILNRVINYANSNPGLRMGLCDILSVTRQTVVAATNETDDAVINCFSELESATYGYSFALEVSYAILFGVIALVINCAGKFSILIFINLFCGLCGIASLFVTIPTLQICCLIGLLLSYLVVPVINAATVDLFATSNRGMAVCLVLMMGRLGGVIGTNTVAIFLDSHCELSFFVGSAFMFVGVILTFFIPNIRKSTSELEQEERQPV